MLSLAISRTILTIKHLEVQLQDLPTYYGLNQDTNIVGHGSLAGGWICVYVPEGTSLNKPFPDYATGKDNYTFMNLISLCLDMVPGLKVGRSIRLTTFLGRDAGVVGISQVLILRLVTICVLEYLSPRS